MLAELACFEQHCRARFPIDEAIYNCPDCGGLLEVVFAAGSVETAAVEEALAHPAHFERAAGAERRVALPRTAAI